MECKVLYLALALCATAAFAAGASVPETRIVGGTPTSIEEFPYIVAVLYYYPNIGIYIQRCVGSIVSSFHILTSAYCYTGANQNYMLMRAGSTNSLDGGVLSTLSNVVKHPDYVETPRQGDIAVAFLSFPLAIGNTIGVLFLPPQNWFIADGQPVKIVSWGFESEQGPQIEFLKTVILNKLPLATCQQQYEGNGDVSITDPIICAAQPGPIGMCLGDSGAPMVIDNVVVGLSSYYVGCGDDRFPDIFTRIDRYTTWILEVAVAPNRNGTAVKVAPSTWRV